MSSIPYSIQHPPKVLGDYIGGEFHPPNDPTGEWAVKSPAASKDEIAKLKYSYIEVDRAVDAAKSAFRRWKKNSFNERAEFLKKYQTALKSREAAFIEIISREVGKPTWESKMEFQTMLNKIDVTLNESMRLISDIEVPDALPSVTGRAKYRPFGPMAVIGPFNFPGHLPNGHIVPALATGNTVIFKPSEKTPMTGQLMAECFHAAGFPAGVFNLLQGEKETGRRLCMHEGVAGVLFTGSYEVGTRIKQDTLQQHWKILALEMGGKNAAIVWEDADFDHAVYEVLFSAFVTAGQRCSSTSRVIVSDTIADKFVERLHKFAKTFKIGHPFENTFMGPLIDHQSTDRFLKFQPIAQRDGFELIMRGKILDTPYGGNYVTPSLCYMKNAKAEAARKSVYQQTELFAPNLAIQSVSTLDEAVALANATQYGLVTSVFSKSKKIFDSAFEELDCGLVNWNRGTVGASSKLPFGGTKKSGNHRPTALSSVFYCTYPVGSLETELTELPATWATGLNPNTK